MAIVLLAGCATASRTPDLAATIDRIATAPELQRGMWAINVEDDAGRVLYARNAEKLMVPASNRKIFAAAAALNCLGPDYRYTTELWLDGTNLVIRGNGDPSLGGRWASDRDAVFATFVDALRARGVTSVDAIIADVSAFDRVTIPGNWKHGNLGADYAAPVDALAYNENVVGIVVENCEKPLVTADPAFLDVAESALCGDGDLNVRVETVGDDNVVRVTGTFKRTFKDLVAIASPGLYAAEALRNALHHACIPVRGSLRLNTTPQQWPERIAVIESQPLWQLLTVMLKNSQNLWAEMMLKSIGGGTYDGGWTQERIFLQDEVGLDPMSFRFVDGSGLAPDDLVTPAAIVRMFRWMNAPGRRGLYWTLLATPGQEGTLRRRLVDLGPRLRGKTGTISGVNTLGGIIAGRNGGYRYFSIMVNHHIDDSVSATKVIDEIVRIVADF
jgi:D-alanyl-D-alanine carboxypeptidase/D-alanyl-D-alanine-endopeptidase (penicillin-binding protein 4)